MTSNNNNPRIFLCHASQDKARVRWLYHKLHDAGLNPWLDEEDLLPGQDWEMEIRKAIESTEYFLVCLSKLAVDKRGFFQKEIKIALDVLDEIPDGKVFLIPILLDECDIPYRLRGKQWVELSDRGIISLFRTIVNQHPHLKGKLNLPKFDTTEQFEPEPAVDYTELHNLLQQERWNEANKETRDILLYLAGKSAARKGDLSEEKDINKIHCSALHKIKHIWATQGAKQLKLLYPYVNIPRKAELESPLFAEMSNWKTRLHACGVKEFMWYLHEGEILYGPKEWFELGFAELVDTDPIAADILCFSSLLQTWHFYPISIELLVKAFEDFKSSKNYATINEKEIRSLIGSSIRNLKSKCFVLDYGNDSFCNHTFVKTLVLAKMDEVSLSFWLSLVLKNINKFFPEPEDDSWPPDRNTVKQLSHVVKSVISAKYSSLKSNWIKLHWSTRAWITELEREENASLLLKLGVYLLKEDNYIGHERDALEFLDFAATILKIKQRSENYLSEKIAKYKRLI